MSVLFGQEIPVEVTKVATSAANWLKIETGTRGIGMGGSQVASGRGIASVPYNPACLAYLNQSETFFSKSYFMMYSPSISFIIHLIISLLFSSLLD